ncbi:MAG: erythromycin esterase family protein [Candidatus Manganitrophaceae bacterium]|nr:MAG: erythromycin esterase family protein [Candidatus Manganitrophaceae bacterium]
METDRAQFSGVQTPKRGGGWIDTLRRLEHRLAGKEDLTPLLNRIGDARVVLLGEASHGTAEYYTWRHLISERLVTEKGFSFIAVEGDWPDCYRVNRYVKGASNSGASAREVLNAFNRWPTWMWANHEVIALTEWLRRFNQKNPEEKRVGFYGLDVYSLWDSMYAVVQYLNRVDPAAAQVAKQAYRCFQPYGEDAQGYARATAFVPASCENEVVQILTMLRRKMQAYSDDREAAFNAEQNALVAKNAELYYRTMVRGGAASWNIRDDHMADTLDRLMRFHGPNAKGIVWEHNTHVGDARATDMADEGMVNIGQLVRERYGEEKGVLVGFGSYRGSVVAAVEWEAPMEIMPVPPAREESWEELLHRIAARDRLILFENLDRLPGKEPFYEWRGHRAIGVVYHPNRERFGNYVPTIMPFRYDAFLYLDETEALHPLHIRPRAEREPPETYPWAA